MKIYARIIRDRMTGADEHLGEFDLAEAPKAGDIVILDGTPYHVHTTHTRTIDDDGKALIGALHTIHIRVSER